MGDDLKEGRDGELRWTVHMAKKEPKKAAVVIAVAMVGGLFGIALIGSVWMFPLGALVILLGTADFLLPVHFELSEKGASRRCGISVSTIPWERVKRVVEGEDGVKVSPLAKSSRLAPFRGVFLLSDGNKQEILSSIEYWRERNAASVG